MKLFKMLAVERLEFQNSMENNCKPFRFLVVFQGREKFSSLNPYFCGGTLGGDGVD